MLLSEIQGLYILVHVYSHMSTAPDLDGLRQYIRPLGAEVTFHSEYAYKNNYRIKNIF